MIHSIQRFISRSLHQERRKDCLLHVLGETARHSLLQSVILG